MAESNCDEDYLFANFNTEPGKEEVVEDGTETAESATETATETANDTEEDIPSKPKKPKKSKKIESKDTHANAQNKYISELEQQNVKLKSIIKRMLGPQVFSMQDKSQMNEEIDLVKKLDEDIQSKPFAIVMFMNNDISTTHRKEISNLMKEISEKDATQDVLMAQKLQPQNSAIPLKAFTTNTKGKRFNPGKNLDGEEPYVICSCQYYKSFYLDRLGVPLLETNPDLTDTTDIPNYPQVFTKALPIVEEALNVRVKQKKQCFNCGGEHHLNECTEPKDHNRIRENRNKFASKGPPKLNFNLDNDELDVRFKHFKAGTISVTLEDALGISLKEHLPPYIYKMRELGYPPGWVLPLDDDGLKVYGADGNLIENADYEEGEIKPIALPDMVNFPGFNADIPSGRS